MKISHVCHVTRNFWICLIINLLVTHVTSKLLYVTHVTYVTWVQKIPKLQHVTYVTGISRTFFLYTYMYVTWVTSVTRVQKSRPFICHACHGDQEAIFKKNENSCHAFHVGHMGHRGPKSQAFYMSRGSRGHSCRK